uniref:hypothetical protein n=1 Tax=Xanthomonas sp. 0924 TaxID=2835534 RepID=UPI003F7EC2E2
MATWPAYARLTLATYSESFEPSIVRTEMERGMPKQRLQNTQVMMNVTGTVLFMTKADALAFEQWYFGELRRIGFFSWTSPKDGITRQARFKDAAIGTLTPLAGDFAISQRSVTLEYLR